MSTPMQWIMARMRRVTSMLFFKTLIGTRSTVGQKRCSGDSFRKPASGVILLPVSHESRSRSRSNPAQKDLDAFNNLACTAVHSGLKPKSMILPDQIHGSVFTVNLSRHVLNKNRTGAI